MIKVNITANNKEESLERTFDSESIRITFCPSNPKESFEFKSSEPLLKDLYLDLVSTYKENDILNFEFKLYDNKSDVFSTINLTNIPINKIDYHTSFGSIFNEYLRFFRV